MQAIYAHFQPRKYWVLGLIVAAAELGPIMGLRTADDSTDKRICTGPTDIYMYVYWPKEIDFSA